MNIVILGLSITSSWGNGHATTYRALVRGLAARGHAVTFLERDTEWYSENRDLENPSYCRVKLYRDRDQLERCHSREISAADLVIVGSYVPDGVAVADVVLRAAGGCTAFYDIDTPVTLAALQIGDARYIHRRQIPLFDLYLSFTGGPTLLRLERSFGAKRARALYCSVDAEVYREDNSIAKDCDLGYLGTYSEDRQPAVDELLIESARTWSAGRFLLAGAQYPTTVVTPPNITRVTHLAPSKHRHFYNRQRFTLNVTRRDMVAAGYSPSVRLFEAAACGTAIISDDWPGMNAFLTPGREILIAKTSRDVLGYVKNLPEAERARIGACARRRVLSSHTSLHRAMELEQYFAQAAGGAHAASLHTMPASRPA
jgi:spore maturation protein CgeB